MENIIVVFNNRNHTMQFASYMKKLGIKCNIVSTPRELSVSCGVSAIFPKSAIKQAKMIIQNFRFSSFVRFYELVNIGVFKKYKPI